MKFKGYLVAYADTEEGYKEIKRKYLGETIAVSKLKAQNNFRYRTGNPSYRQMYSGTYGDNAIDYFYEVEKVSD